MQNELIKDCDGVGLRWGVMKKSIRGKITNCRYIAKDNLTVE